MNHTLQQDLLDGGRWIKDVSELGLKAKCIHIFDTWRGDTYEVLTPGEIYEISHIRMTTDFTYIYLKGVEGDFNSVCFEFYLDGKEHDICNDERCWSDALVKRHTALLKRYPAHETANEEK